MIGSTNTKSAFINYDKNNEKFFKNFSDNIGLDFHIKKVEVNNDLRCQLQIWNVNESESFHFLYPSYFRGTAVFLLFFDITDRRSFLDLPLWIDIIHSYSEEVPIFLIGTNSESPSTISEEHITSLINAHELIGPYFISVEKGFNIDIVFSHIAEVLTSTPILSKKEKAYLQNDLSRFPQNFQVSAPSTPPLSELNEAPNVGFEEYENCDNDIQEPPNDLLRLRDIMRGDLEIQCYKEIELNSAERSELQEFLEFFKYCPICNSLNHKSYLKRFYLSKDEIKMKIKQSLLALKDESEHFKKRYYNHISLGIPCCECFQKYFNDFKIEHN